MYTNTKKKGSNDLLPQLTQTQYNTQKSAHVVPWILKIGHLSLLYWQENNYLHKCHPYSYLLDKPIPPISTNVFHWKHLLMRLSIITESKEKKLCTMLAPPNPHHHHRRRRHGMHNCIYVKYNVQTEWKTSHQRCLSSQTYAIF